MWYGIAFAADTPLIAKLFPLLHVAMGIGLTYFTLAGLVNRTTVEVIESNAYRNVVTGGWRLALRVKRQDDKKPAELRAFLRNGTTTLSETWSYILPVN